MFLEIYEMNFNPTMSPHIGMHQSHSLTRFEKSPVRDNTFSDQCSFLGNQPPTPPLSQHYYLLLTQCKMLGQGRGRWAVSQKPKFHHIFLLGKQLLKLTCPMGKGAASHPVTKSLPKASKTWPGTSKCESCLPKGQAGIHDFSTPNLTQVRD